MVKLLKPYATFATGAYVILPTDTEAALITQGIAIASTATVVPEVLGGPDQVATMGGNKAIVVQAGVSTPAYYQGPLAVNTIPIGAAALTGFETNGAVHVAGTIHLTEIFVPHLATWTGAAALNGTTVATDKVIHALYGSDGTLLANTALAGTTTATASVFQNVAFTTPITLLPGRYFIATQLNGNTDTLRHILAANGAFVCCSSATGAFGTLPATVTPPSTFTTAVGVIARLYV